MEIIVVCYFRFILLTGFAPVPDTCPIRDISPFDIHPLGTSVTAVKADTEPDRICILSGNLFGGIHQFAANAFSPIFFQYTKVDNLRPTFSAERTAQACDVDIDISGRMPFINSGQ